MAWRMIRKFLTSELFDWHMKYRHQEFISQSREKNDRFNTSLVQWLLGEQKPICAPLFLICSNWAG